MSLLKKRDKREKRRKKRDGWLATNRLGLRRIKKKMQRVYTFLNLLVIKISSVKIFNKLKKN